MITSLRFVVLSSRHWVGIKDHEQFMRQRNRSNYLSYDGLNKKIVCDN